MELTDFQKDCQKLDVALDRLHDRKAAWLQVSIPERIAYLEQCLQGVMAVAADWSIAACQAKDIDPMMPIAGEEWLSGVVSVMVGLRSLIKTLRSHKTTGFERPDRTAQPQPIVQMFPNHWIDRLLWFGYRGELWLEPGQPVTQGRIYRQANQPDQGQVSLVLGAGNVSATAPLDLFYKLIAENQVVLLKMNPVNQYLGHFLAQALQPLIRDGFCAIVNGGVETGRYLCQHPRVDTIHITGSHHTHDAIVWGDTAAEQSTRKATQNPVCAKPITSELGCVTPILVVPGVWSEGDLAFQARHVASMVAHNASFNCVAAQVLVTAKGWPQRQAFLAHLQQAFQQIPSRTAYYPGAQARYQAFLDRYPQAQVFGDRTEQIVPWTLIQDISPEDDYALTTEAFCGVLVEVGLAAPEAADFLRQAVAFANDRIWGNLSCVVLIDRPTQTRHAADFKTAITHLAYGAIGVNVWTGVIYGLADFSWGAFPGNPLTAIQSGQGVVHNAGLWDHPQKSVLYAPFRIRPTPFWFSQHRNLMNFAQRAAQLQVTPNWQTLLSVIRASLQG